MNPDWLAIIVGIVGIAGTLTAWFFNPRRKIYAELDQITERLGRLYEIRDKALHENDNDTLTAVTFDIGVLQSRRAEILQRLG